MQVTVRIHAQTMVKWKKKIIAIQCSELQIEHIFHMMFFCVIYRCGGWSRLTFCVTVDRLFSVKLKISIFHFENSWDLRESLKFAFCACAAFCWNSKWNWLQSTAVESAKCRPLVASTDVHKLLVENGISQLLFHCARRIRQTHEMMSFFCFFFRQMHHKNSSEIIRRSQLDSILIVC